MIYFDENGNIVSSLTNEQKKLAKTFRYNPGDICKRIKEDGEICGKPLIPENAKREVGDKGNLTGKWICHRCKAKYYDIDRNSMAAWRTGSLSVNSPAGKGFIGAQVVAKTCELDDCNVKMNNFNFYIDLSKHSVYGYIEVKTVSLSIEYMRWMVHLRNWNFDTLIIVCMDCESPWKNVLRVYAIPREYVDGLQGVQIPAGGSIDKLGRSSKGTKWDKFRIDEKPFNDTYHKMDIDKCKVLRKD